MRRFRAVRIRKIGLVAVFCLTGLSLLVLPVSGETQRRSRASKKVIQLPSPNLSGTVSLEQAINIRRSVRQFTDQTLNSAEMGQLAWAGQGITDKQNGLRAAPSAWEVYPIELYFAAPDGLYIYNPEEHAFEQISGSDQRKQLSAAATGQGAAADAPCVIVIAGSTRKLAPKAGNRAIRFLLLEAGQVCANIQLQAAALRLGSVSISSFEVKSVAKACEMSVDIEPLSIIYVGHPLVKLEGESESGEKSEIKIVLFIVPATGFRDEELFAPQRILTEAGISTAIASSKIGTLQGALGGIAASEMTLDKVKVEEFDAVVFVGGPGADEYFNNAAALGIAKEAAARRKVLAAISTAPTILANAGLLNGVRSTGLLAVREQMQKGGAKYTGAPVERDGLIITASDPAAVVPFAQAITSTLIPKQPKSGKKP